MKLELECLVDISGTADWRRRMSAEYPHDARNIGAAETLDRLAGELHRLEGSAVHAKLSALWEQSNDGRFIEATSEVLRSVGFWRFPSTAEELLEDIADTVR